MYRNIVLAIALSALLAFGIAQGADKVADSTKAVAKTALVKPHEQTVCPITSEKINKEYYSDYEGQRIYFSGPKCAAQFATDPDKYVKQAVADGVEFENVQKVCPVTGDKINKKVYTEFQGRKVYFCCKKCVAVFKADPAKYLERFDMPADSVKWDTDVM